MKSEKLHVIFTVLLALIIFTIPANLFLKFFVNSAYVHGLLVDYLLPKIYISDIFIFILLAFWGTELFLSKKIFRLRTFSWQMGVWFFFLIVLFGRQFFTDKPLAAIWYLSKIIEMFFLGYFLFSHTKIIRSKAFIFSWIAVLLFESSLAFFQFSRQTSFFHSYLFFGEPNLSHSIGLAKMKWGGEVKILPYGTTPHPNILAGFLVVGIIIILHFFLLQKVPRKHDVLFAALLTIFATPILYALLLTQSLSAWLTLFWGLLLWPVFYFLRRKNAFFLFFAVIILACITTPFLLHLFAPQFANNLSIIRRDQLNQAGINMIIHQPLFGIGLNNFTAVVENFRPATEVVRFVQPAHNVAILWIAETGLLGIFFLCWVIFCLFHQPKILRAILFAFMSMLPIITLDHYILTQQTGLLLFVFLSLSFLTFPTKDLGWVKD